MVWLQAAKEARYDKEAVMKFFRMVCIYVLVVSLCLLPADRCLTLLLWLFQLIRRRYFSDDLPAQNPWSISPAESPAQTVDENWSDEDHSYRKKTR